MIRWGDLISGPVEMEMDVEIPNLELETTVEVPRPSPQIPPLPPLRYPQVPLFGINPETRVRGKAPFSMNVQVVFIIDDTTFMGRYYGGLLKCKAFPSTANLSIGDAVVVTRIEASTEYFYWENIVVEDEILYFSPGKSPETGQAELWKMTTPTSEPTHVWDVPGTDEFVTSLAWSHETEYLYVFTWDVVTEEMKVYEYNVTADIGALVAGPSGENYYNPPYDVAEFGGNLYLCCGARYAGTCLTKFDPRTYHIEMVSNGGDVYGIAGGVAVLEGRIVFCDGRVLLDSSDGSSGSFTQVADLATLFPGWADQGNCLTTHLTDGKIYFNLYAAMDIEGYQHSPICCWDGSSLAVEYDQGSSLGWSRRGFKSLGFDFTGTAPNNIYAALWFNNPDLYRRGGGSWGLDKSMPATHYTLTGQNLIPFGGKSYWLLWDTSINGSRLYRRDGVDNLTEIKNWPGFEVCWGMSDPRLTGITLARSLKACHEL